MNDSILAFDKLLEHHFPDVKCGLEAGGDPYKLLMMAILSAQCTDKRVNIVSRDLFKKYPTVYSLAKCDINELEDIVKPCGLYHSKASNMKKCCERLISDFNGNVPEKMDDLLSLAGVGRKIANLIRGDIFSLGGIVADTHLIRISNRLGFVSNAVPEKVEKALSAVVPNERQSDFCHRVVHFGREICSARSPKCSECFVFSAGLCKGI